jgi:hypothetical protein
LQSIAHAARAAALPLLDGSDGQVMDLLATYLIDPASWQVQAAAAYACMVLRRFVSDAVVKHLYLLRLHSPSHAVRDAADRALVAILATDTGIEDD